MNGEGFRPLKQADQFDGDMVGRIFRRRVPSAKRDASLWLDQLQPNEWLAVDLAAKLQIPKNTLHAWIRRGWIHHRKLAGYRAPCICWADESELQRLRRLRQTPHGWWDPALPKTLVAPKERANCE